MASKVTWQKLKKQKVPMSEWPAEALDAYHRFVHPTQFRKYAPTRLRKKMYSESPNHGGRF